MSKKKLAGIIAACIVCIIVVIVIATPSPPPTEDLPKEGDAAPTENLPKEDDTERYWIELALAEAELAIAELRGIYDPAADRRWERAMEEVGSADLIAAYDEYITALVEYMYSDAPEYMWEEEWQEVEVKMLAFYEIYAEELRAYLEGRTDRYWLEASLAATDLAIAELRGIYDPAADRRWERAMEEVGSADLIAAYDEYITALVEYMYSDAPEYMWEEEWQEVEVKMLAFYEIYAEELRAYLEGG